MSTNATPAPGSAIPDIQTAVAGLEQVAVAGASPFIHSEKGKATEQKVVAEVNLGIAALPLLANLFQTIAGLFHHAHKQATAPPPASQPPAAQ